MTDAQVAEIKAAKEKLMESAQKLFAKMYEQNPAGCRGAGWTGHGQELVPGQRQATEMML